MAYMPNSLCTYIRLLCQYIYISYELNAINNVTSNTAIHTSHITDICPWTNRPATLHIYVPLHFFCSLHIDPILMHASIKCQQTTTFICNTTPKYVPVTNVPLKCYICQMPKLRMCISDGNMPIYMPHMSSLTLAMWQGALYTDDNDADAGQWLCHSPITYLELATWQNQWKTPKYAYMCMYVCKSPLCMYKAPSI